MLVAFVLRMFRTKLVLIITVRQALREDQHQYTVSQAWRDPLQIKVKFMVRMIQRYQVLV